MYRKVTIKDKEGKKIKFEVHPDQGDLIKEQADEINLTLKTRSAILTFVRSIKAVMDGNTINKVEVEEIE